MDAQIRQTAIENYGPDYFKRPVDELTYYDHNLLRPDQYFALLYSFGYSPNHKKLDRNPGKVLSIGCGRGELEYELKGRFANVLGIDILDLREFKDFEFRLGGMEIIKDIEFDFDTVIFCETLEHIPPEEFWSQWDRWVKLMKGMKTRLIITNWEDVFPIVAEPGAWEHCFTIDDALFDRLSESAKEVIHRKGAHLVLQF